MASLVRQWGRWNVMGANLVLFAPGSRQAVVALVDLRRPDGLRTALARIAPLRFVEVEDLFNLRRAARELVGEDAGNG